MIGGQTNAAVLQRTDDSGRLEGAVHRVFDRVEGGDVHVLQHGGQGDVGVLRIGLDPVGVHADDVHAAALLGSGSGAEANGSGHGHDDVGALIHQRLAEAAAVVGAFEVAREEPGLSHRIPAQHLNLGAVLLVVVLDAVVEAIHEDGDGRDLNAAEGANDTRLSDTSSNVAGQEGRLVGIEDLGLHVLDRRIIGEVNDGEQLVRVGFRSSRCRVTEQEADGDDDAAAFLDERVDVLLVVRLLL